MDQELRKNLKQIANSRALISTSPLEGFPNIFIEAWSCGRAVVASSLACQGIQARHGENVMVADNPQDFAMWTIALLSHPEFCRELGIRARQLAQSEYDWKILGRQLIQLYREMTGTETSPQRTSTGSDLNPNG